MTADRPDEVRVLLDEIRSLGDRVARLETMFGIFDEFLERRIRHAV